MNCFLILHDLICPFVKDYINDLIHVMVFIVLNGFGVPNVLYYSGTLIQRQFLAYVKIDAVAKLMLY